MTIEKKGASKVQDCVGANQTMSEYPVVSQYNRYLQVIEEKF